MKIAIDGGVLQGESKTRGLGVYTRNLFDALKKLSQEKKFEIDLIDASDMTLLSKYDLIHYPKFDFFFPTLPLKRKIPTVVTVHDTIPLLYPNAYPPGIKGKLNFYKQKLALGSTSAVVTDSETSKKDIVRFLGIKSEKIHPIYLGPTVNKKHIGTSNLEKYNLPNSYVVYVGDVNYNKNLNILCKVCDSNKINLVIVGKKAVSETFDKNHIENKPLLDLLNKYGKSKYIHRIGYVPDEELPDVIKGAFCYCQPSSYEGFGLGVLDAMTLGVPTLCSKTQTLVEIYEKASIFFDPNSSEDLKEKIIKLRQSKNTKDTLTKKGLTFAKEFTWEKAAKETLDVYLKVLS